MIDHNSLHVMNACVTIADNCDHRFIILIPVNKIRSFIATKRKQKQSNNVHFQDRFN